VDPAHLGAQIASGLAQRYSLPAPAVSCPAHEANTAGTTFACTTALAGTALTIDVQVAAPDQVHWQPAASVISTANTARAIDQRFGPQLGATLRATCGPAPIRVVAVGSSFGCSATVDGSARTFQVEARDLTGNVDISLLPPASGPGATMPPVTAPATPGTTPASGTLPGD
jgi:hypothetical protein